MRSWKPIKTAPKDGTPLLLYIPTLEGRKAPYVAQGQFHEERWVAAVPTNFEIVMFGVGWVQSPSHWMPLPKAPN